MFDQSQPYNEINKKLTQETSKISFILVIINNSLFIWN